MSLLLIFKIIRIAFHCCDVNGCISQSRLLAGIFGNGVVTVGKTGIFVGNMGDRFPAGPKEGTAARIIVLPVSIADKSVDMGESVDEL